ncbi:MAG: cytochrome c maturation protein CcmE [Thermomicrobiaceae bacterium]
MSKNRAWFNPKFAIAATVLVCAVGYLMFTSTQSTSASFFDTVSELDARADQNDGQLVRVGGDVVEESIEIDGVAGPVYFEITDGESELAVVYDGQVPDIFDEHIQAVVEGTYHKDGVFEADTVLTKCPSRFEDGDKEDHDGDYDEEDYEEYEEFHEDDGDSETAVAD